MADDYITKPFNASELIAIVNSQLKRYTRYTVLQNLAKNKIEVGKLIIKEDLEVTLNVVGNDEIAKLCKKY